MTTSDAQGIVSIALPLVFGIFAVILLAIFSNRANAKRALEFQGLANELGLQCYPDGMSIAAYEASLSSIFGGGNQSATCPHQPDFMAFFDFFKQGHSRGIRPAIVGNDSVGRQWFLFDYRFTTGSGKNQTTHQYSVIVSKTEVVFPDMTMTREHFLNTLGKMLGAKELQVESEEFNRRYYIKTSDSKMSLDLLHPRAMEAMLQQEGVEWFTSGMFIMIPAIGKADAATYRRRKQYIDEFLSLVPTYYKQDHPARL